MATEPSGAIQANPPSHHDKSRFILRHVKFRNFVKFEDEQELKFERNGVYFLLGQNQSGKTSVLEAIRRCLSLRYSSSFSSRPEHDKESIIVTRYENENDEALLAFCMYKMHKCKDSVIDVCLKGCAILDKDTTVSLDLVHFQSGNLISRQIPASSEGVPNASEIDLDAFQGWIRKQYDEAECVVSDDERGTKDLNSKCEQLLKQYLDDVVFAFPMRSFGPLQWSKSVKVEKQSDNYQEASKRAEIIMWYLKRCGEMNVDRTNEERKEKEYFNFITNNRGGRYVLYASKSERKEEEKEEEDSSNIRHKNASRKDTQHTNQLQSRTDSNHKKDRREETANHQHKFTQTEEKLQFEIKVEKDGSKPFFILKQSEGFVEAKLCSILLSVEDFATVAIEDPGTGMHPQMIDRLCLIMTERVNDRVVIVPTHNANFIKPWLLDRMFYFKRTDSGLFKIAPGKSLSENKDLKAAIPGSVTSEQFANFCYAETIVFVEGISDQLFMEALARLMLRSDNNYYSLLSGFQFVNMGGQGKVQYFRKCCKLLNKRFAFIIDNDSKSKTLRPLEKTILDELLQEKRKDPSSTNTSRFEKEHGDRLRQTLMAEKELYFFWNGKDLEDVFWCMLKLLYGAKLNKGVKAVIEACFPPQYVSFDVIGRDTDETERFEITNVETPSKNDKFKLFVHGTETFEQRVELIKYLLEQAESVGEAVGSKLDLVRIHEFLQKLCN